MPGPAEEQLQPGRRAGSSLGAPHGPGPAWAGRGTQALLAADGKTFPALPPPELCLSWEMWNKGPVLLLIRELGLHW